MSRLLLLLLFLAGCGRAQPPADRSFTDDLGRTVVLEAPAGRVATLAPSLTEIVFAAGGGPRVVGVSTADDYPPAVDTLPRFSALPVDFERIVQLQPDLVFATDQVNNPKDAETLAALGIPAVFFTFRGIADVVEAIRSTGRLIGTAPEADRAADSLEGAVRTLEQLSAARTDPPRVLVLAGDRTLYAFGGESYVNDLVALAGGRSVTADLPGQSAVLSDEFVLQAGPDVIIGLFGDDYDPALLVELHPTWRHVPAASTGRIHSIDASLLSRPGPRLVAGTRRMAGLFYPGDEALRASPAPGPVP